MQMLKKLFGGKKDFYAQLDEKQAPEASADPVTAVATEEAQEASPESSAPTKTASKKTSTQKKSAKKTAKTPAPEATPEPVAVAPGPKTKPDPSQVAFASGDPVPQNIARRNPGPSLNRFKDMARQVKTKVR